MKKIYFVLWCLIFCQMTIFGQTKRYLYIHNTNNQQFNVKIEHRIYASDDAGNLIIPQLSDGVIGFSVIPHQQTGFIPAFQLQLDDRNQGWDLTLSNETAILENWTTKEQLKPLSVNETDNWWNGTKKKNNHFAQMMSDLVADSAVLYTTNMILPSAKTTDIAKTDPRLAAKNGETVVTVVTQDTVSLVEELAAKEEIDTLVIAVKDEAVQTAKEDTVMPAIAVGAAITKDSIQVPPVIPAVKLKNDLITEEGRKMSYAVMNGEEEETVDVFIPVDSVRTTTAIKDTSVVKTKEELVTKVEETKPEPVKETPAAAPAGSTAPPKDTFVMYNSDCKEVTTDAEIDKYRVRLLSLSQEQRFTQVQKYLKAKCFTTKQIKALSELFSTDDDKYRFFELAYPFVEETTTFKELIELLNGDLNRTKFKQMTRMQ